MRALIFIPLFFCCINCFAQWQHDSIQRKINGALLFLQQSQKQETDGFNYWKGEWGSVLENTQMSVYFGNKGKNAYDSNCFSTATVHNILAEIYLQHSEYTSIPPMLQLAEDCISTYEIEGGFSFWHSIPASPYSIRSKDKSKLVGVFMRRPNHFIYDAPYCNRYANVPNDADDTALGYLAYFLGNEVAKIDSTFIPKSLPTHLDSLFGKWRDIRKTRRSFSYYNYTNGNARRTGAFLTWFSKERVYTPWALFFPYHTKPNLPQQANEVDCVVNANILHTLSTFQLYQTEGVKEAELFLLDAMQNKKKCYTCGVYYPTEFTAHYAVSKAIVGGAVALNRAVPFMVDLILSKQETNGRWKSELPDNDVQSSVYAILTLLNVGDLKDNKTVTAIQKGIKFIHSQAITDNGMVHWKGGIYFSGGTVVRDTHVWRSDAVTTALCLDALVKFQQIEK